MTINEGGIAIIVFHVECQCGNLIEGFLIGNGEGNTNEAGGISATHLKNRIVNKFTKVASDSFKTNASLDCLP